MHDIVFRTALVLLALAVPAWIALSLGTVLGRVAYDRRTGATRRDRSRSLSRGD